MRTLLLVIVASLPAVAVADDEAEARAHFAAGAAAYEDGRYNEAAREFVMAAKTYPSPALEYNLARALDQAGDLAAAVAAYRRFLAAGIESDDATFVRERLLVLEAMRPPRPLAVAEVPAARPAPQRRRPVRAAAWAMAGVALGLAAAGAGLAGSAHADYGALTCAPLCAESDWSGIRSREHAGAAVLGLAGAALVADVVLWAVSARGRR